MAACEFPVHGDFETSLTELALARADEIDHPVSAQTKASQNQERSEFVDESRPR
jgi:hypothetical protein